MGELRVRTWRWFVARLAALPPDSAWSYAVWPEDPDTGKRSRRDPVQVIDDEAAVEAFFARQGAG